LQFTTISDYYIDNMSLRILWRSTVFVLTLLFIYLAFPILIVPSSLPAIQAMFIDQEMPQGYNPSDSLANNLETDAQIYEINIPTIPTLTDKITVLKDFHRQGMDLILQR